MCVSDGVIFSRGSREPQRHDRLPNASPPQGDSRQEKRRRPQRTNHDLVHLRYHGHIRGGLRPSIRVEVLLRREKALPNVRRVLKLQLKLL